MSTQQLDIGSVLSRVFEIYRDQAAVLLGAALGIFVLEAVISGLLVGISFALFFVALLVTVVATLFYQGMVVELVRDVQDGRRDSSVEGLFRSVGPVLLPLLGAAILAGLAVGIGLVLLIVPGLILLTIWAVLIPVVVLERPGVIAAFGRSRELVRGNGWNVFGVIAVVFLIQFLVGFIFGGIGAAAGTVGRIILDVIGSVITAPIAALAATVLYLNLRTLKGEPAPGAGAAVAEPAASAAPAPPPPTGQEAPPPPPPPAS